ncbi:MAG: Crp/Fnr family transcriptional regulator [Pirellulaceae bacterium]
MPTPNARPSADSQRCIKARAALNHIPHFSDLPPEVKTAIARVASICHFDAGQVIYLEGEPAEAVYLLENGWVKATRMSLDGREQAMMFLRAGEAFGDVAVFTDTAYPCTVVALEPVDLWIVDKSAILELVARYPDLAMAVIRRLGERVLHYVGLVEDLSLRSVEARLAHTLLRHAQMRDGRLRVPRQTWTTFDEMATRLGTVRDVLSRALKRLEDEGLLRVERHEITILDPGGLAARASA